MLKVLLLFFVLVSELRFPYAGLSGIKDDSNSKKLSINSILVPLNAISVISVL